MIRPSVLFSLTFLVLAGPAQSANLVERPAECRAAEHLIKSAFPLGLVARALAAKRLDILVVGAGSTLLPGSNGAKSAYPARLQLALSENLPGVEVKVSANVRARRNVIETVKTLSLALVAAKPALLVWGIGAADAIQAVDPDEFSLALDKGIKIARSAGADVVLVNPQYSPRTESMIAVGTYSEEMLWVALKREVPLFDRYSIMKLWADLGMFDFYSSTKKLDIAERVHDCLGRLLADLLIEAAKSGERRTSHELR